MDCALCDPGPGPAVLETGRWRVIVNLNQDLLGKVMIVARRHVEPVVELTHLEWGELREVMRRASAALIGAFGPAL